MTEFRLVLELPVRFSDTDAIGHVNNAAYLSYLEEARFAYAQRVIGLREWRKVSFILARVEIDYRSPAFCGETLAVAIRACRIGGASFDCAYRLAEKSSGRLVAEARTVQVWYDYQAGKVARIPAEVAARLRAFDDIPA